VPVAAAVRHVRALWGAVTGRGRAFVAVGIACLVAAQLVGERDLLRVGVLLLALPLISMAIVARTRYRLRLVRTLAPTRIEAGGTTRVLLKLENVSRVPSMALRMEDTLPYALGGRPRFMLRRLEPSGAREATYTVRCDVRGRYEVGPLTVRLADPFGCVELTRAFPARDLLTVSPQVHELPAVSLGGDGHLGGAGRAALAAVTGDADIAIREYRQGDDLRKVHWRSTARRGALMVRRDELPRHNRATVLLDNRGHLHRGEGPANSFEWAASAAASIGVWLARRDYAIRLVTTSGLATGPASGGSAENALLDLLAVVTPDRDADFGALLRAIDDQPTGSTAGLVIAIIPVPDEQMALQLAPVPRLVNSAVAVVVDTAGWRAGSAAHGAGTPSDAALRARRRLAAHGWRVVTAGHGESIARLWPQAGPADSAVVPRYLGTSR